MYNLCKVHRSHCASVDPYSKKSQITEDLSPMQGKLVAMAQLGVRLLWVLVGG
jgi:hypothetical protein